MRITESKLRSMIRGILLENESNHEFYTFEFGNNWEVKKVREIEGAKIVSVKESVDPEEEDILFLLVSVPGGRGVILYQYAWSEYMMVDVEYLEGGDDTGELVFKPFDEVKKEFERQTKEIELFMRVSQRSMEKIKYFRENRVMWDRFANRPPEYQARADFYMMHLGFDEIKPIQSHHYSDYEIEEFLQIIIGVDGKYDEKFEEFLKGKFLKGKYN
tara:strand:+ start:2962 stop:3609 length:648 start_codon:yes stop_codon:yes gene_type:complete